MTHHMYHVHTNPLQGLATSHFQAGGRSAARAWYSDLFASEPYFVRDGYLEWRFGRDDDEFGIIDARFVSGHAEREPGGQYVYWSVDDVRSTIDDLVRRGATVFEPATDRGVGWVSGAVVDPFGNILGLIQNPHWRGEE